MYYNADKKIYKSGINQIENRILLKIVLTHRSHIASTASVRSNKR